MRIGIDARLWDETGVGRYIRNLVRNLTQIDKKNSYVLFVRNPQNFLRQLADPNFQSNKWKIVKANIHWHTIEEQVRLPAILEKERLDLVHFPYFSVPIFYKGKFVVTIHDLIPLHFDTGRASTLPLPFYKAKRLGYKLVLRQAAKKASKIIAVSDSTKDEVVKHLKVDPEKVVVTYEGVDEKIRNLKHEIRNKFRNSKFEIRNYFLYVGNAYPHKNLERLLDAFKKTLHPRGVVSQHPGGGRMDSPGVDSLVLVGKEDYFYKRLKEQVKAMGLTNSVIFYVPASDEELGALYRNAKALIIPSLMEGFGLPALEAMANGCLVLAADIPALRETCGEAAIYFNPYDVEDIKAKMELVCSYDLDQCSKNCEIGLKRAKRFSWKKMAEETLKVYEEVV